MLVNADGSNCFFLGVSRGVSRVQPFLPSLQSTRYFGGRIKRNYANNIDDDKVRGDGNLADDGDDDSIYLKGLGRRERKRALARREHERRRDAWLARYGSIEALRQTFGGGGQDLTPSQTRALYHALLPRSLLALSELGVLDPSDLAPLAYRARIAAKEYARSRCTLSGKILTAMVDQYRSVKNGGGLLGPGSNPSMTWEDVFEKYEAQIVEEERSDASNRKGGEQPAIDEEEIMMKIYMRILEKSCATNQAFDAIFLNEDGDDDEEDELRRISLQLEEDIHSILLSPKDAEAVKKRREKIEKRRAKAERKEEKLKAKAEEKEEKLKRKLEKLRLKLDLEIDRASEES